MTVFLGGRSSPKQIAVFDWTTSTYKRLNSKLRGDRWLSSCSLLRNENGSLLVAVFGGYYSSGLEVWNPEDGTVTTLADLDLPSGAKTRISSQLKSINNNTEILLFGGYSDNGAVYHDNVWKYSFNTNSWAKVAKMSGPKSSFVLSPVDKTDFFEPKSG